jgi:hypothetical protein
MGLLGMQGMPDAKLRNLHFGNPRSTRICHSDSPTSISFGILNPRKNSQKGKDMANQIASHAGRDRGGFKAFDDQVDAQRKLPQRDRDGGDRRRRGHRFDEAE